MHKCHSMKIGELEELELIILRESNHGLTALSVKKQLEYRFYLRVNYGHLQSMLNKLLRAGYVSAGFSQTQNRQRGHFEITHRGITYLLLEGSYLYAQSDAHEYLDHLNYAK